MEILNALNTWVCKAWLFLPCPGPAQGLSAAKSAARSIQKTAGVWVQMNDGPPSDIITCKFEAHRFPHLQLAAATPGRTVVSTTLSAFWFALLPENLVIISVHVPVNEGTRCCTFAAQFAAPRPAVQLAACLKVSLHGGTCRFGMHRSLTTTAAGVQAAKLGSWKVPVTKPPSGDTGDAAPAGAAASLLMQAVAADPEAAGRAWFGSADFERCVTGVEQMWDRLTVPSDVVHTQM